MTNATTINPEKKTLFVSVTRGLAGRMMPDIDPGKTPLIDCARGCWHVNPVEADKCEWLMAVNSGRVVGVYEINKDFGWKSATVGCIPTRRILNDDSSSFYCQLQDISNGAGKPYMNQYIRMYRSTQYG